MGLTSMGPTQATKVSHWGLKCLWRRPSHLTLASCFSAAFPTGHCCCYWSPKLLQLRLLMRSNSPSWRDLTNGSKLAFVWTSFILPECKSQRGINWLPTWKRSWNLPNITRPWKGCDGQLRASHAVSLDHKKDKWVRTCLTVALWM